MRPIDLNFVLRESDSRKKPNPKTADLPPIIRTCGEIFPTGETIELIGGANNGEPVRLQLTDGKRVTIASELEFGGRLFRPARLGSSIRRIVKFPKTSVKFESTTRLFAAVQQVFKNGGFFDEVATAVTYFIFATWFAEILPCAPCLFITGAPLEATLLLQLLGCLARRPLPTGEFSRRLFSSLPTGLQPTLLINADRIGTANLGLLRASNRHNAFFPLKGEFVDSFCAKAFYLGETFENDLLGEDLLHVSVGPFQGTLPLLEEKLAKEITEKFQPQFLAYRCRHILDVRQSKFDIPELTAGTRMLARVLGAPMVDAPALQTGLSRLLRDFEEEKQAHQWTDVRFVTIEALLHHSHCDPGQRAHVGKIAGTVTDILKGRGDMTKRNSKEIGGFIRDFGLRPKRDSGGFAILFDPAACRQVHKIALAHNVAAIQKRKPDCEYCAPVGART